VPPCPQLPAELTLFADPPSIRTTSRIRLQLGRIGVMDMDVAVITAEGDSKMNEIPEKPADNEANTPPVAQTPAKTPRVAAQPRHVAWSKRGSAPGQEGQQRPEVGQVA
jgi:hypothetical protein